MMYRLWETQIPGAQGQEPQDIPTLTPYLVKRPGKRTSSVIVCPGGGYHHLAAHEGEPIALWLNSVGISAFVLKYRVAPYRDPYPLLDAQRAVRFVRHNAEEWHIDPERVGILGFSAGGHLVSTIGTRFDHGNAEATDPIDRQSCRPDALILCYPVISFGEFSHSGSVQALLGPDASDGQKQDRTSHLHVTPETPPAFLWHTAEDQAVPVENSLLFAGALSRNGVPFELHVFPKGRHGLGLAKGMEGTEKWTELCAIWLKQLGF